jgi:hypothetical protein
MEKVTEELNVEKRSHEEEKARHFKTKEQLRQMQEQLQRTQEQLQRSQEFQRQLQEQIRSLTEDNKRLRRDLETAQSQQQVISSQPQEPRNINESTSPAYDAPTEDGPPMDGPPMDAPPMDAPPIDAPPMDGPPMDGPPMDGPPMDAPPMDAPPMDAPSAPSHADLFAQIKQGSKLKKAESRSTPSSPPPSSNPASAHDMLVAAIKARGAGNAGTHLRKVADRKIAEKPYEPPSAPKVEKKTSGQTLFNAIKGTDTNKKQEYCPVLMSGMKECPLKTDKVHLKTYNHSIPPWVAIPNPSAGQT